MRKLFTDGWNSFWHFAFGTLSIRFSFGIPLFVTYQLVTIDPNVTIDLSEFAVGYFTAYCLFMRTLTHIPCLPRQY